MTVTASTITVGKAGKRPLLDFGAEDESSRAALHYEASVPAAASLRGTRLSAARWLMNIFAGGLIISVFSAVGFEIAGSDDGVFISALASGGFLSLTATAALRWFSRGRL